MFTVQIACTLNLLMILHHIVTIKKNVKYGIVKIVDGFQKDLTINHIKKKGDNMALHKQYKQYDVTLEEKSKYNPITRTIKVHADDELHARQLVSSEFDSYRWDKKLMTHVPTEKHIKIIKVKEIKEEKNKKE